MKKIILSIALLTILSFSYAQTSTDLRSNDDWTWFGIDYTNCYFLTKLDFPNVTDLEYKIQAWNDLVLIEREKYITKTLVGKTIDYHTEMVEALNGKIDVKSRLSNDGFLATHMEEVMIQEIVSSYNIPDELTGIGLILIAESYSKPNVQGAYFVTFFDIETQRVLITERMLGKAKGFGLRNYWANSYYKVLQNVGKKYK